MDGTVTSTFTVQVAPAAIVPLEKEMETAFATGAKVGTPQLVVDAFGVAATRICPGVVGNVSVNVTPVRPLLWFGLVIVNVSVDVPPDKIGFGENSLDMLGGLITVKEADALPVDPVFVPPFVVDKNPLTF